MFEMPSLYQTQNYILEVPRFALSALSEHCTTHTYPCDEDFYNLCNILMIENHLTRQNDPHHATEVYQSLRRIVKNIFQS